MAGKGDMPRPCDRKAYERGYMLIDWGRGKSRRSDHILSVDQSVGGHDYSGMVMLTDQGYRRVTALGELKPVSQQVGRLSARVDGRPAARKKVAHG